jgi:hypothetical protein
MTEIEWIDYCEDYFGVCLNCQCELTENYVADEDWNRYCSKECRREWRKRHVTY